MSPRTIAQPIRSERFPLQNTHHPTQRYGSRAHMWWFDGYSFHSGPVSAPVCPSGPANQHVFAKNQHYCFEIRL